MPSAVDHAAPAREFLQCPTPQRWIEAACQQLDVILLDHANCEKKAATTALTLMQRYGSDARRVQQLSRLAREELRHFEQVTALLVRRGIALRGLSASRYAPRLRAQLRRNAGEQLLDTLLVSAIIEARSCERFATLAPYLDTELASFYSSLLASEARHFEVYLRMAESLATDGGVAHRLSQLLTIEAELINTPDTQLRFHSGIPVVVTQNTQEV